MKIGFIGAGKVGTAFGLYLRNHGFNILGYYSRSDESSKRAAELTKTNQYLQLKDLTLESNTLFITTNDDEIGKVIDKLINENLLRPGQHLIHMSGASTSDVLKDAAKLGC